MQTEASSTPPSKIVNTSIDGSDVANAEPVDATFSIQDETNGFGFANATFDVGGNHETHHTEPSMAINNETFDATSELSQINPFENEQQCVEESQEPGNIVEILVNEAALMLPRSKQKPEEEMVNETTDKLSTATSVTIINAKRSTRSRAGALLNSVEKDSATVCYGEKIPTVVDYVETDSTVACSVEDELTTASIENEENVPPSRSTRTSQKDVSAQAEDDTIARQNEVDEESRPVSQATRDLAGMRRSVGRLSRSLRRSSVGHSLKKASAARNLPISEVLLEQEVIIKKGPTIKKSPNILNTSTSALNSSRAPAGKIVKPGRNVFASGGRGVSPATGPRSGSNTGSSSLVRSRSRLAIIERNGKTTPSKPNTPSKATTPSKQLDAKQRRDNLRKNKIEEQRLKNEERIRRVQEARQKQESQRKEKDKKNTEREKEEKLALLKKRENALKAEAEKRKKEKLKEDEDRRNRDLEDQQERITREREEMKKIEEMDAMKLAEVNSTRTVQAADATLNRTHTTDQSQVKESIITENFHIFHP